MNAWHSGAPVAALSGDDRTAVDRRVAWAVETGLVDRILARDHNAWSPDPTELSNRLGWLDVAAEVEPELGAIREFAAELAADGITDCVVLGMGGSSLAPEVMRRSLPADGLTLHVLDSTHPDTVKALADRLPLASTVFIFASKSGSTIEPDSFYRYFRGLVPDGNAFIAVTDPGTGLAHRAADENFRKTFVANPDIGGRFSALSHFGMVPATLAGIDTAAILHHANTARSKVSPSADSHGVWLGLALGELARRGRDKLTLVIDEPISSFGIWAEQLVAESTGKHGVGIVPVVDEPLGEATAYGNDRVFVHIRNTEADSAETDARLAELAERGHPVITQNFTDPTEIGALFFEWELAIAVTGAVLEINPFDQPNVQEAKDLAKSVIAGYLDTGELPAMPDGPAEGELAAHGSKANALDGALGEIVAATRSGRYFAVLAFVPESTGADAALEQIRLIIRNTRHAATTTGYGPRYLHSTGQLHKGGASNGVFLHITCDGTPGVDVPGTGYDFEALVRSQATGDYQAIAGKGLPVLNVHIAGDVVAGLENIAARLAAATG